MDSYLNFCYNDVSKYNYEKGKLKFKVIHPFANKKKININYFSCNLLK